MFGKSAKNNRKSAVNTRKVVKCHKYRRNLSSDQNSRHFGKCPKQSQNSEYQAFQVHGDGSWNVLGDFPNLTLSALDFDPYQVPELFEMSHVSFQVCIMLHVFFCAWHMDSNVATPLPLVVTKHQPSPNRTCRAWGSAARRAASSAASAAWYITYGHLWPRIMGKPWWTLMNHGIMGFQSW